MTQDLKHMKKSLKSHKTKPKKKTLVQKLVDIMDLYGFRAIHNEEILKQFKINPEKVTRKETHAAEELYDALEKRLKRHVAILNGTLNGKRYKIVKKKLVFKKKGKKKLTLKKRRRLSVKKK